MYARAKFTKNNKQSINKKKIEPDLRWQKKRQVFQIVIESNQFITYSLCLECKF